jgi:hypothetical protein
MKKLLYGLIFISSAALMAMDTEEFDSAETADSSSFINDNENFASAESFEFSLDSENNDSIEETSHLENLPNSPYLFINPTHVLIKSRNALDELNAAVGLTKALESKVDAYLNGKTTAETLYPIDSRIHITPVLDRLLVCDNQQKEKAIEAIVLHAPRECYHCPVERLEQAILREGYCQTFILSNPMDTWFACLSSQSPLSSLSAASKVAIATKFGFISYLITQLPLTALVQDEVFKNVMTSKILQLISAEKNNKTLFQNKLEKLTINDLQKINSTIERYSLASERAEHYDQAVIRTKTEWAESLKKARATFDREEGIYLLHAPSKKQRAFDKIVKPIVAEILPNHQIEYVNGFDSDDE